MGVTVRSLMMSEEFLGVTVRSLMMSEEVWASRCALSWCFGSFTRHGALSHGVLGVVRVTPRSLMMSEGVWASRCALS